MAQWLRTMVENNTSLGISAAGSTVVTKDLPRSNFIGSLGFRVRPTGTTGENTMDRVRIVANGSSILWDTDGGTLRGIAKYEQGNFQFAQPLDVVATKTSPYVGWITFGRYRRDEDVILPARAFKSLQIQFSITAGTATSAMNLDMWTEELVTTDKAASKRIKTVRSTNTFAGTNGTTRVTIPLGNVIRAFYVKTADYRNLGGTSASDPTGTALQRLLINNGAEIPVSLTLQSWLDDLISTYRFHDDNVPGNETVGIVANNFEGETTGANRLLKLDFDVTETLHRTIDTSHMNEMRLELVGASGATGNVEVLQEEIIALG